jgi:hypothetical protein
VGVAVVDERQEFDRGALEARVVGGDHVGPVSRVIAVKRNRRQMRDRGIGSGESTFRAAVAADQQQREAGLGLALPALDVIPGGERLVGPRPGREARPRPRQSLRSFRVADPRVAVRR